MSTERYLRVQVFLRNGGDIEGILIDKITFETKLAFSKRSIAAIRNKRGILVYRGRAKATFIEKRMIHSVAPLN